MSGRLDDGDHDVTCTKLLLRSVVLDALVLSSAPGARLAQPYQRAHCTVIAEVCTVSRHGLAIGRATPATSLKSFQPSARRPPSTVSTGRILELSSNFYKLDVEMTHARPEWKRGRANIT